MSYFIDLTQPDERPPYDHFLPSRRADDDRYVVYVRKALPDQGVPAAPAAMTDILDYLARALEVGHCVYVHCCAGIGRSNMVAGCWLRRGGLPGGEAILRLNRLWRTNPHAASWPHVPATPEQQHYVEHWSEPVADPDRDQEPPVDPAAVQWLRSRYQGALLGLACGDAIGATMQFRKPGQAAPISGLIGGGHWQLPPGAWTDDTAISLCLAESLITEEKFDATDQRRRYRRWRQESHLTSTGQCVGITAQMAAALRREDASEPPVERGFAAGGAHAVTRAGVVALFAASHPERAFSWAAAAAAATDPAVAARHAAMVYAALMLAALGGAGRAGLIDGARDLWRAHAAMPAGIFDVAVGAGTSSRPLVDGGDPAVSDPFAVLGVVVGALSSAAGFREGLLGLVNRGGDADLHGALFGQLAGALYGVEAIPAAWRAGLLRRALLQDFADRLLIAALAPHD